MAKPRKAYVVMDISLGEKRQGGYEPCSGTNEFADKGYHIVGVFGPTYDFQWRQ